MVNSASSKATKELLFSFILENLEYRKKCLYLQEIVSLGKADNIWQKALLAFFDSPMKLDSPATFCKN